MAASIRILKNVHVPIEKEFDVLMEKVWPRLRPHWTRDNVTTTEISGGFVNHMTLYHLTSDVSRQDAYVVRLYGNAGQLLGSRKSEILGMQCIHTIGGVRGAERESQSTNTLRTMHTDGKQIAHHAGCFSEVLAVVENGTIYKYSEGKVLDETDMRKPHIIRPAARALAQLHWVPLDGVSLIDRVGEPLQLEKTCGFINKMRQNIDTALTASNTSTSAHRSVKEVDVSVLREEVDFIERYIADLHLPLANVHHDMNNNNILYDDKTGHVTLVDYEYFEYGIAIFDLSYLLDQYVWYPFGGGGRLSLPSHPESQETIELWMISYLERKYELQGRDPADLTRKEIDVWLLSLQIMNAMLWAYVASRFLVVVETGINEQALDMYKFFMKTYFERKSDLAGLREKYLRLKAELD